MSKSLVVIAILAGAIIGMIMPTIGFAQDTLITLSVTPDDVQDNLFYNGSNLNISAKFPLCDGIAFKLEGERETVTLHKMGKVGPLWMTVEQITVVNAPHTYMLKSSAPLNELASAEQLWEFELGYESFRKSISLSSGEPLSDSDFTQFIRLQEKWRLYNINGDGGIDPKAPKRGHLIDTLALPPVIPIGKYRLDFYCFKGGRVIAHAEHNVIIEEIGVPKYMYSLATERRGLYGIMAIVVAMGAGVLMSVIFSSCGRCKK